MKKTEKPTALERKLYLALKGLIVQTCVNGCPEFHGKDRQGNDTLIVKCTPQCKAARRTLKSAQRKWTKEGVTPWTS